jgi:hypothetical protein
MNKIIAVLTSLLTVVLGIVAFVQYQAAQRASRDLVATRLQLEEAKRSTDSRSGEIEALRQRIEKLSQANKDLPGLRGEVTQLRQQTAELKKEVAQAERTATTARSRLEASRESSKREPGAPGVREISLAQAPAHIRNRIAQQYPGLEVAELAQITEDGRTLFALEGVAANERDMRAVLDANGEILEQVMEIGFAEAPAAVQRAVGQQLGRDGGIDMEQVWEDGRTRYFGNAEKNGQEMHFVFSESGDLVRYETWVEQPDE